MSETRGWYEVTAVMCVLADTRNAAINRIAHAIRDRSPDGELVYAVGTFDARPCANPLTTPRQRQRPCPAHPAFPVDDCPRCDRAIEEAELAREFPPDEPPPGYREP